MTRFFVFYSLMLALSVIPGGLAGPACARKHRGAVDCVQKCKAKWGWAGRVMGTDRWGSVIGKVEESSKIWETIVAQACDSSVTSVQTTTVSSVAAPSVPVIGAGNDPAETAQPAPTSSPALSSSSIAVTSPAISSSTPYSTAIFSAPRPVTSVVTKSSQTAMVSATTRFTTSIRPPPVPTTTKEITTTQAPPPPPPPAATPPANSGSDSGSTSSSDIQAYLIAHNSIRANHGAAALVWSNDLASKAQQWVTGCKFQHSGGSLGPFGENLAAGTGSSYSISQAIKSWTDEVGQYNANNPQPSHFTQVVWKGSQQVGCAVHECDGIFSSQFGKAKYYVCEYFPAGNVIGQFPQNVQV